MTNPTNAERAAWAEAALLDLCAATGCDLDDALPDLLTDLMHWAQRTSLDFEAALARARRHFAAER